MIHRKEYVLGTKDGKVLLSLQDEDGEWRSYSFDPKIAMKMLTDFNRICTELSFSAFVDDVTDSWGIF